ncbi:MAG: hypothetical protein K2P23_17020 [Lachnospiraceae bacterium]|nr:hypothetical protein [Lachnospiraceae bacterium]
MEKHIIRLLRADEIECRAASVSEKGVSLLLYKDARVDQRILDETFGIFGWQRSHQCIDGSLYCTVEVYDRDSGTWVAKQDVGTPGYAEKEKSLASDSFKRACFNWGIGRELYTAPFIWIPADRTEIQRRGERYICNDGFSVYSISYSADREITELVICNRRGTPVYEFGLKSAGRTEEGRKEAGIKGKAAAEKETGKGKAVQDKPLSRKQMDFLKAELERTGVAMETVQDRYHIKKPETMSEALYNRVMEALSKTKNTAA